MGSKAKFREIEGDKYPRITSILSCTDPVARLKSLAYWKQKHPWESESAPIRGSLVHKYFELVMALPFEERVVVVDAVEESVKQGAELGGEEMLKVLNEYLAHDDFDDTVRQFMTRHENANRLMPDILKFCHSYRNLILSVSRIYWIEGKREKNRCAWTSGDHKFCCVPDMVCELHAKPGELFLIDFKTSSRPYETKASSRTGFFKFEKTCTQLAGQARALKNCKGWEFDGEHRLVAVARHGGLQMIPVTNLEAEEPWDLLQSSETDLDIRLHQYYRRINKPEADVDNEITET